MITIQMEVEHLTMFKPHGDHAEIKGVSVRENAEELISGGHAFTFMANDGDIIGCGGMAKFWEGRYMFWALLGESSGPYMTSLTKFARRLMMLADGRVEAIVKSDFELGRRWVEAIGLEWHHHEEKFLPGGHDADVYVRFL